MTNNDVLRRLRYTFNFNDGKMIAIFRSAEVQVTRAQIGAWLKKDEDKEFKHCSDYELAVFLNGLINELRGKREGVQPVAEKRLTNNLILTKLKIALNLKSEDILDILKLANFRMSANELSAFFRKPDHRNYRTCNDQILRNFLTGVQHKYRSADKGKA